MIGKFRKKPIVVEAVQWTGGNFREVFEFCPDSGLSLEVLFIETPEGTMRANVGDWIIRGVNGEFYPCKPDVFEQTYELVEASEEETLR